MPRRSAVEKRARKRRMRRESGFADAVREINGRHKRARLGPSDQVSLEGQLLGRQHHEIASAVQIGSEQAMGRQAFARRESAIQNRSLQCPGDLAC